MAEIKTKTIEYKSGDATLEGVLAYDDTKTGKQPGIIVVHEWWGNNDYSKRRAKQLAELGYVAFAADMFGKGKTTDDPKQAGSWADTIRKDSSLMHARFRAAEEQLKAQPNVDPQQIGAIGYCFGGSVVLGEALDGENLAAVVSFHGGVPADDAAQQAKNVKGQILICNGAADKWSTKEQVDSFSKSLSDAGVRVRVINYPGAQHAFTNPDADTHHMDNIKYNAAADHKSWEDMKEFLAKAFGKS